MTPRVLVVTAETGEPQVGRATAALLAQQGVEVEQVLISGLPMVEAQRSVHEHMMRARGSFDWALKLDGDMVPASTTAIAAMVDRAETAAPARYTEPVLDWYTDLQIEGVHLVRPMAVPAEIDVEPPFYDRWLSALPAVVVARLDNPNVLHAPDPDTSQAIRFGLQRGTKARAQGSRGPHWHRLAELSRNQRRSRDVRLSAALVGAAVGLRTLDLGPPRTPDLSSRADALHARLSHCTDAQLQQLAESLDSIGSFADTYRRFYGSSETLRFGLAHARRHVRYATASIHRPPGSSRR